MPANAWCQRGASTGHASMPIIGRAPLGRSRRCKHVAAALNPAGLPVASAPPLPPELRTSERVKYPEVYQGGEYATGGPGAEQGQAPVAESLLARDAVAAQDQGGPAYTGYEQQQAPGGRGRRAHAPAQQRRQPMQLIEVERALRAPQAWLDANPWARPLFAGIALLLAGSFKKSAAHVERALRAPQAWLDTNPWARPLFAGVALLLAGSFALSTVRVVQRYNSPRAKRARTVDLNKELVDALNQYLPANRAGLTAGAVRGIRARSGFSAMEVFRKYLWYVLRERKFDEEAVDDLAALRAALSMSDEETAEALRERAARIYDKYGNVMLETAGMTKTGIERKATCRALFSKLLYLAESEKLMSQTGEAAAKLSIPKIFGATDEDTDGLRIVSLYEVDLDNLEGQFGP